jgi:hypothetical protein
MCGCVLYVFLYVRGEERTRLWTVVDDRFANFFSELSLHGLPARFVLGGVLSASLAGFVSSSAREHVLIIVVGFDEENGEGIVFVASTVGNGGTDARLAVEVGIVLVDILGALSVRKDAVDDLVDFECEHRRDQPVSRVIPGTAERIELLGYEFVDVHSMFNYSFLIPS